MQTPAFPTPATPGMLPHSRFPTALPQHLQPCLSLPLLYYSLFPSVSTSRELSAITSGLQQVEDVLLHMPSPRLL